VVTSGYLYEQLAGYMIHTFRSIPAVDLENRAGGYLSETMSVIFNCSLPIMILTATCGVLVNFLIIGPVFSAEPMKFDLKKLNPVTNIKNMFKFKTLFELLKSIFKITGAIILIYMVVMDSLPEIIATAGIPVLGTALVFSSFLMKVILRVGIFFLAIAIIDLIFQKKNFSKEMKMEKFEVKQEYKDTEGDPQIKSKRRQVAQEIAYQEGPGAVRKARAVITNPVHIAVAVDYDPAKEPAPRIVTMGKGIVADQIIKAAIEYHIPIMRNVPLAHTLFEKGKISEFIPEETYQAVAEILKWLAAMEGKEEVSSELFK
jgi:type III secretion protein U